jgi:hemoglobin-like flavoprotein
LIENPRVRYHSNQLVKTLEKIINLMTNSLSTNEQEKEKLFELGQRHYHCGLKKEHFTLFENCFIKCLYECLQVEIFQEKFENPWRKFIQHIFKHYTDGMKFEGKKEIISK